MLPGCSGTLEHELLSLMGAISTTIATDLSAFSIAIRSLSASFLASRSLAWAGG
jgi:hypothetical protein